MQRMLHTCSPQGMQPHISERLLGGQNGACLGDAPLCSNWHRRWHAGCSASQTLPPALLRARAVRRAGLAGSGLLLATGAAVALSSGAAIPTPPARVLQAALAAIAAPLAALAAAKAALADDLRIELHEGQLHIQWVPVSGQTCRAEAIQVPASTARLRSMLGRPAWQVHHAHPCAVYMLTCAENSRRYAHAQMRVVEVHLPGSASLVAHASASMKGSC